MARYLIARLSSLGDVVCTLPVAAALRAWQPDCHITWVVDPRFRGVVAASAAVDEIIAHVPKWGDFPRYDAPFDAALDMQGLLKSGLAVAFAKAPVKRGYHWQREGSGLFSAAVKPDPTSIHMVDQYVDVVRSLGATTDRAEFMMRPEPDAVAHVSERLQEAGIGGYVVVNGGAGWATKRWPAGHIAHLSRMIRERDVTPIMVGGNADADRAVVAEVESAGGEVVNWVGQTNIPQLIALISGAAAHVGGDTGSTHIAAALGVPAVGLYSITRPERSCPYGQIDRCLYRPESLAAIPPESAMAQVDRALSEG